MSPRVQRGRRLIAFGGSVVLAASAVAAAPTSATPEEPVDLAPAEAVEHEVTLVTGDVVTVATRPGAENPAITVDSSGPSGGHASVYEEDGDTHVVPLAAYPLLEADAVDPSLFNIDGLIAQGLDDASVDEIPLIVQAGPDGEGLQTMSALAERALESIDAEAVAVDKSDTATIWAEWSEEVAQGERRAAAQGRPTKLWLDATVTVQLEDSVPQIGAPDVWDAGFDGAGITVAVLDTGIDVTHPDLVGQIDEAVNFTDAQDAVDRHGHGTHVAATVAGAGAGNGASGVAPGADIIVGKVLNDGGSGQLSWIIDGMEWAAESGADVVSMSLGTDERDDGNGPVSVALDALSADHDTLFVVAAGNAGVDSIGQPASATSALTVGAVDDDDRLASFSSTGPRYGDHMIKPEISAPGVGIVAARATGTNMGTPVDDLYTSADGTSMATPHVAGAAALLLQARPDLDAQQAKSVLVGSVAPMTAAAFAAGAGRVDAPGAVSAPAYAEPSTMTFGAVRYAEDGAYEPVTEDVVIYNTGDVDQTFALSAAGNELSGVAIPDEALTLGASEVVVPAGESATVSLTIDPEPLQRDRSYSGMLLAEGTDGQVRIPFSLYKEPLLYEANLTVVDRAGEPATGAAVLVSESGPLARQVYFTEGAASFRVPPGSYTLQSLAYTLEPSTGWPESVTGTVQAAVDLTDSDQDITIDAREATELVLTTEEETHRAAGGFGFAREGAMDWTYLVGPETPRIYLTPTEQLDGGLAVTTYSTLVAPPVTVEVAGARGLDLNPRVLGGVARLDGQHTLRLFDAGVGDPAELPAGTLRNRVVLVQSSDLPLADVLAVLAERDATAVILRPGDVGGLPTAVEGAGIPVMGVTADEGEALAERAAQRSTAVSVTGTPFSPFVYELVHTFDQGVAAEDLNIEVSKAELAAIDANYYQRSDDTTALAVNWYRDRGLYHYVTSEVPVRLGISMQQYLTPGAGVEYWQGLVVGDILFHQQTWHSLGAGEATEDWLKAVNNTRLDPAQPDWFSQRHYGASETAMITVGARPFTDSDPDHIFTAVMADAYSLEVHRNGELVGDLPYWYGNWSIPRELADFEVTQVVTRDHPAWHFAPKVTTTWSFQAGDVEGTSKPITMPLVEYDAGLDLTNRVAAGTEHQLSVDARDWNGADVSVEQVESWVSYDDGDTWVALELTESDVPGVFLGTYETPAAAEFVSLRSVAMDSNGHHVDQVVERAFGVTSGR